MFDSKDPMIKIKIKQQDAVAVGEAVAACRRMHKGILTQLEGPIPTVSELDKMLV